MTIRLRRLSPTARCPCGGTYHAVEADEEGEEEYEAEGVVMMPGDFALVHSEPHCERFMSLGVVDFMQYARTNGAEVVN